MCELWELWPIRGDVGIISLLGTFGAIGLAAGPAVFVFILTLAISLVTGHPQGLFFTRSIIGIPLRFIVMTLVITAPILILPRRMRFAAKVVKRTTIFGQFVRTAKTNLELSRHVAWLIRPLQGVGISLIVSEKFVTLLEPSTGGSLSRPFLTTVLILIGVALASVFLSMAWTLDDLGVRIHNQKTGEVHMAGSRLGTVLPIVTGAVGVSALFHASFSLDAFITLVQIFMVLYPPYVLFVALHHAFVRKRYNVLSEKLTLGSK